MISRFTAAALAAGFTLAAVVPAAAADTMMAKPGGPHQITVQMKALNGSGESGTAMLRDTKSGLWVMISVSATSELAKGPQPAHIHKGSCTKLDPAPQYPLKNVVAGKSTTTVPGVTIADLLKTPHAINVHDAKDLKKYVSCGNIIWLGQKAAM